MWTWIKSLFSPPVFEGDVEKTRAASPLNAMLWFLIWACAIGAVSFRLSVDGVNIGAVNLIFISVSVFSVFLLVALHSGYVKLVSVLLLLMVWAAGTIPIYSFDGLRDGAVVVYYFAIILASLSASLWVLFGFTVLTLLSLAGVYLAERQGFLTTSMTVVGPPPFSDLLINVLGIIGSALLLRFIVESIESAYRRVRNTAAALSESNRELQSSRDKLQAQTRELERRTRYLMATADIARNTTALLERDALLKRLVALLGERFALNRVGIFLLNATGEWLDALVRAAFVSGQIHIMDASQRFAADGDSFIGHVTQRGESYIEAGACSEALFFDIEGLAEPCSEAMLPLRAQNRVIGVLAMQSTQPGAFQASDLAPLQALADLVAVAINNAQLFDRAQESLDAERRARGELTREAWQRLLSVEPDLGYVSNRGETLPAEDLWSPEMELAFQEAETVVDEENRLCLAIPVQVAGEVIGVVHGCKSKESGDWTSDEIALMDTLTAQLDAAVERARLYRETQRRAADEQMLNRITANLARSLDMSTVLQTVVRELGQSLPVDEVSVLVGGQGTGHPSAGQTSARAPELHKEE